MTAWSIGVLYGLCGPAFAQPGGFTLDADGSFREDPAPAPGTDEALIADARRLIALERFEEAEELLGRFIDANERTDNPWLADAYLLRGDAHLAQDREYDALFDYEVVLREFTGAAAFPVAVERELGIAKRYLAGLRRRFLGVRVEPARLLGEELIIRVQERMPASGLAEDAAITLADHYFERRDMRLASEMYGIFVENFPASEDATRARRMQILANVARFKGPEYDATGLIDARELIESYQARYPAEQGTSGITVALASRIDESAAGSMLETARWYLRRKDEPAAKFTLERLLRKHPRSAAAQVALSTLAERGWLPRPEDGEAGPDATQGGPP